MPQAAKSQPPPVSTFRQNEVIVVRARDIVSSKPVSTHHSRDLKRWAVIALPAFATLFLGYFAGREHFQYQMKRAIADVGKASAQSIKTNDAQNAIADTSIPNTQSEPRETVEADNAMLVPVASSPSIENSSMAERQLALGEFFDSKAFSIALVAARIEKPQVKQVMGDIAVATSPALVLHFKVNNIDDRRILRFRKGNMFLAGHFRLRDDVENVIRGVDYGFASKPIGQLTGSEDIEPGATATHLEIFSVPPSKTEYLILTVDLACFGGEGAFEVKIPAEDIRKS